MDGIAAIQGRIAQIEARITGSTAASSGATGAQANYLGTGSTMSADTFSTVLAQKLTAAGVGSTDVAGLLGQAGLSSLAGLSGTTALSGTTGLSSTTGLGGLAGISGATGDAVTRQAAANAALSMVGSQYVWGAATPGSFDCSGLVSWAYAQQGISVPHYSGDIREMGTVISREEARPGDVIWIPGHVTLYLGGDMQVEANGSTGVVQTDQIWQQNPIFLRIA
jgi:cell wall-associated NlpC family hydrolase